MDEELIEIEILNWNKYQHHNGSKTYSWFKVSAHILDDPQINSLSPPQFKTWIKLLSECAKFRRGTIKIHTRLLASTIGLRTRSIRDTILTLERYHILTIKTGTLEENRIEENRITPTPLSKNEHITKKRRSSSLADSSFDFNKIYEKYPRKLGKQSGLRTCVKIISSQDEFNRLEKAVINFAEAMVNENRPLEMIPYFSTWIKSQWQDWVDVSNQEDVFDRLKAKLIAEGRLTE